MKVLYQETIQDKVDNAITEARSKSKTIDRIILSKSEFKEMLNILGSYQRTSFFCEKDSISYHGIRIVQGLDCNDVQSDHRMLEVKGKCKSKDNNTLDRSLSDKMMARYNTKTCTV